MIKTYLGRPSQGMLLYVPPAVEKAAVPVVTTPIGAGQSVGHPSKKRKPVAVAVTQLDLFTSKVVA